VAWGSWLDSTWNCGVGIPLFSPRPGSGGEKCFCWAEVRRSFDLAIQEERSALAMRGHQSKCGTPGVEGLRLQEEATHPWVEATRSRHPSDSRTISRLRKNEP
jgi:hypothetical protein